MKYNARDIAVDALRDRAGNVSARLERLLAKHQPDTQQRSLAVELALGVVRRRGTIRAVLGNYLKRPKKPVPPHVKQILSTAIYQMLYLDRVPAFAAVNEAVEQTRRFKRIRYRTMVNAILRSIERDRGELHSGKAPHEARAVPVGPDAHWRFGRDVLPDPEKDLPAWLAAAHSLPPWLVHRWVKQYSAERVSQLGYHANARAPLVVRVNALRAGISQAAAMLKEEGFEAVAHKNGVSLVLPEHGNIAATRAFAEGLIQPQDAMATAVGLAAGPQPHMRVLDFCAAPGTKTTHLAELMHNCGQIVAVDVSAEKLSRIEENCSRMGHTIVDCCLAQDIGRLELESFDLVLADVPCSNTGVLARRAEARWRLQPEDIERLVRDQHLLVSAAAAYVKPGGKLIYATCSLEQDENENVSRAIPRKQSKFSLQQSHLTRPGGVGDPASWSDGGYYAVLGR